MNLLLKARQLCIGLMCLIALSAHAQSLRKLDEPFSALALLAQNKPQAALDSLMAFEPEIASDPTTLAQYHLVLSQAFYNLTYPKKALEYAQLALTYTSLTEQPWLYHKVKISQALALENSGHASEALAEINDSVEWAKQHDALLYLDSLFARGIIFTTLTEYVSALSDFQLAYSLANDDPTTLSKAHIASMLAQVYEYRHEDKLSIPFYEEAIAAHRLNQAHLELSIALYGLGKANRSLGNITLAKAQLIESKEAAEKIDDIQGVAYALKELADIDIIELKFEEAERDLKKAADIFAQADNHQMRFNVMLSLVNLSFKTSELSKAQAYLDQAEAFLDRANMPTHSIGFDEVKADLLYRQQHYQQAYERLLSAFSAHKKVQNNNSTERLHQLRSRFEIQLAQQENQVLSQKNAIQKLQLSSEKNDRIQLILISAFSLLACLLMLVTVQRSRAYKRKLEKLVNIDELTGLYNRRHTMQVLSEHIEWACKHNKNLCLAMIDLDWFKKINDSYGHLVGDKVLREFAYVFRKGLRGSDVIGRIGGEEFLAIFKQANGKQAHEALSHLSDQLRCIGRTIGEPNIQVTISVGLVEYQHEDTVESLLASADEALYIAKNNGRNQIVLAQRTLNPLSDQNQLSE
ncbi:GGDEF domain-containing protein [Paraglaciecola sp.]|uniref:GGDEF domain-containing protein n=1 Tax=Paraglaciecola sp. TaxID=1920173 RepID=UPI00273DCB08|nr:GGDEF domain-containing protein [Paraglaciecola sp.]MDP5029096.1 GGDEF domain-containing protein [Paraglaciecola sp.]